MFHNNLKILLMITSTREIQRRNGRMTSNRFMLLSFGLLLKIAVPLIPNKLRETTPTELNLHNTSPKYLQTKNPANRRGFLLYEVNNLLQQHHLLSLYKSNCLYLVYVNPGSHWFAIVICSVPYD